MHPTAKRCVASGVVLLVVGALVIAFGPDVYAAIARAAGYNADIGLKTFDLALTLIRSSFMPLGSVLIGAAVVIQALSPRAAADPSEPTG